MAYIYFDREAYIRALTKSIYEAVEELTDDLYSEVISRIGRINLSPTDREQGFTTAGIQSELMKKMYPASIKQVIMQGGKIIGDVRLAGGKGSIIGLFYEYGTGEYEETPIGRWKHLSPNVHKTGKPIVGRSVQNRPKGVKTEHWTGESYPVIKGSHGHILKHTTKGLKAGQYLPNMAVPAYRFMRDSAKAMRGKIKSRLLEAVNSVSPKDHMKFKDIRVGRG